MLTWGMMNHIHAVAAAICDDDAPHEAQSPRILMGKSGQRMRRNGNEKEWISAREVPGNGGMSVRLTSDTASVAE